MVKRSGKGPSQRQLRAGELIRHAIADILRREEVRDRDLQGVSITVSEVRASPDLKQATVYCTPLGGANKDAVLAGLNRSAKFIRGRLAREIDLKFTPALRFAFDDTFEAASDMDALLRRDDVRRDLTK